MQRQTERYADFFSEKLGKSFLTLSLWGIKKCFFLIGFNRLYFKWILEIEVLDFYLNRETHGG